VRYKELNIQTLREAPKNSRTAGAAFLVRGGYVTRENQPTSLGEYTLDHIAHQIQEQGEDFIHSLLIPVINCEQELFFPTTNGNQEIVHCSSCGYAARLEIARFQKVPLPPEQVLELEKIETPDCHTIEALAAFLEVPQAKTAKALLYTRQSDQKLVFAIVRGDMQLSLAKLENQVGNLSPATEAQITASGAVAGYASPIGVRDALIIVDELIPLSTNLVAGANEAGFHIKHVNYDRDFSAEIICDLALAREGDACIQCGSPLNVLTAEFLSSQENSDPMAILHAIAQTHHDERGLAWTVSGSPFLVYLMQVPGKTIDTLKASQEIHDLCQAHGITVLFDDREDRAGVKFNDADLIGCPLRITVGEKNLTNGMVELKLRPANESVLKPVDTILEAIQDILK
jgi:prolyl-tRNA synthetase